MVLVSPAKYSSSPFSLGGGPGVCRGPVWPHISKASGREGALYPKEQMILEPSLNHMWGFHALLEKEAGGERSNLPLRVAVGSPCHWTSLLPSALGVDRALTSG